MNPRTGTKNDCFFCMGVLITPLVMQGSAIWAITVSREISVANGQRPSCIRFGDIMKGMGTANDPKKGTTQDTHQRG